MFVPSPASSPPLGSVPVQAGPRVWRVPRWDNLGNAARAGELARIGREAASDPRLRRLAVMIFRAAGVQPRDYEGQAAAILAFLQEHVYFVNEKDEVLQDPCYTLDLQADGTVGPNAAGDCDDFCTAFYALCASVHLAVRVVTSGMLRGRPVRYVEGLGRSPAGAQWSHVYNQVANHPFKPTSWAYADATVPGARLGWDIVSARGGDPQGPGFGDAGGPVGSLSGWELVGVAILSAAASAVIVKQLQRLGVA